MQNGDRRSINIVPLHGFAVPSYQRITKREPNYGELGREFKLRPLFAGSIFTFWKRIEPLASTTSPASTPRKTQLTKRTSSITAPGKLAIHITRGLATLLTFSSLTLRTIGL